MGKTKKQKTSIKPKNQNYLENVWFEAYVCFFLVFLEFFVFFGYDFEKTKKNSIFFWFLKELLLEIRQKTKKNSGLFWFFAWIFSYNFLIINLSKKPKKPWFFFSFLKVMT